MNIRPPVFVFLLVLVVNIASRLLTIPWLEYISKPLIIVSLVALFLVNTKAISSELKKWILLALIFSWMGDVLLMFQDRDAIFFILGLSSFLIAHIFYIVFFHIIRIREMVKSNIWFLLLVVIYYVALISFLSPYLGEMKLAVRVYGIVISFMFMLAMHMLFIRNRAAGKWMMVGALLFVISDSVLALNKFYQAFYLADTLIMLTYGLAQLFIVEGAIQYLRERETQLKS